MPILLVELPVSILELDESRFPDRDDSQILDHLVRYCARFDPLPAVTVTIEGEHATIVRGHKYLAAAHTLKRSRIRAVIGSPSTSEDVGAFLRRPDVTQLDWEAIERDEARVAEPMAWHVLFFGHPLSQDQKSRFAERMGTIFHPAPLRVLHDDSGPSAEFRAKTPVNDHAWATRLLEVLGDFAREQESIVSYQGRRFSR